MRTTIFTMVYTIVFSLVLVAATTRSIIIIVTVLFSTKERDIEFCFPRCKTIYFGVLIIY